MASNSHGPAAGCDPGVHRLDIGMLRLKLSELPAVPLPFAGL
jgi:hypothetical protein